MMATKRHKYRNVKTAVRMGKELYRFDSKAEARCFVALYDKLKTGKALKLILQPSYTVSDAYRINTSKTKSGKSKVSKIVYTPDFEYIDTNGDIVAVEVKGFADTAYSLRKKLFLACAWKRHGVAKFVEVKNGVEVVYDCKSVEEV